MMMGRQEREGWDAVVGMSADNVWAQRGGALGNTSFSFFPRRRSLHHLGHLFCAVGGTGMA